MLIVRIQRVVFVVLQCAVKARMMIPLPEKRSRRRPRGSLTSVSKISKRLILGAEKSQLRSKVKIRQT